MIPLNCYSGQASLSDNASLVLLDVSHGGRINTQGEFDSGCGGISMIGELLAVSYVQILMHSTP